MSTLPRIQLDRNEAIEEQYELPEDHRLAGCTVDVLLRQGKVEEARDELERLAMEGVDSGPAIPATPECWADLKAEIHELARSRR